MTDLTDKIAIVTGANSGLGKATAMGLAKMGATVVMICRSRERGETAQRDIIQQTGNQNVHLLQADLSVQAEVRRVAEEFKERFDQLGLLVNNAGVTLYERHTTPDGIEATLAINHLASFLLTHLLLDVLHASAPARIININTVPWRNTTIHFDDLNFEKRKFSGFAAYSETKTANLMFTFELARRLEGTGVTVNAVHPGVFKSNLGKHNRPRPFSVMFWFMSPFVATPEQAAERVIHVAASPEWAAQTGRYIGKGAKDIQPPPQCREDAVVEQLWTMSEHLTGLA
ncbi:MAG: SDR family oxidoreductase [Anaerolineae bacterium]|nr:MAG: SDR family oxidoreductase [Anaerolineae bacterium]